MARPIRFRIPGELGQLRTLPDDVRPDDVRPDNVLTDARPDDLRPGGAADSRAPASPPLRPVRLPTTFDALPPRDPAAPPVSEVVVLGVGPNPATAHRAVHAALAALRGAGAPSGAQPAPAIYFIECPAFIRYMEAETRGAWRTALPSGWAQAAPEAFPPRRLSRALVVRYREAERLFPSFWGPLLGTAQAVRLAPALALEPDPTGGNPPERAGTAAARSRTVLLPGTEDSLLLPELATALAAEGLTPRRVHAQTLHTDLPDLLADERPALLLSVNLQGLDAWGACFHLLRACGVPVAVWCVDNPFHLLSALRGPWWREAHLCVTDASFIPPLRALGARRVLHLPLAASPELFTAENPPASEPIAAPPLAGGRPLPPPPGHVQGEPALSGTDRAPWGRPVPEGMHPVVFVGRSAFPGKSGFFAGQRIAPGLLDQARTLLDAPGPRPDFHWWTARLGIDTLWPGNAVRAAGLGAEECALTRRVRCLAAAAPHGLTVFGDEGWRPLLAPDTDLRPPVDYYTALPAVYRAARWSLNVTSLLLPAGLTQRHFDVWTAGGFCITDDTPGLHLFPDELRREIAFSPIRSRRRKAARSAVKDDAPDLDGLLHRLESDPRLRGDLVTAWQTHILTRHTYRHRVRALCDALGLA